MRSAKSSGAAMLAGLDETAIEARFALQFRGEIEQQPPMHSAIKIGGRRLYEIAREGGSVEIPARTVLISRLEMTRFWPGSNPRALFQVECSGGTYIRSLVRDIGRALRSAATMTFLTRTRSGHFALSQSLTLSEFEAAPRLLPLGQILETLAGSARVDDSATRHLWQGQRVTLDFDSLEPNGTGDLVLYCAMSRNPCGCWRRRCIDDAPGSVRGSAKVFDLSEK